MSPPLGFGPHIIPQKQFSFGATQAQPCYGFDATHTNLICFGPHVVPQRTPTRCKYKGKLLWAKKVLEESFAANILFYDDILPYIPTHTLNKIRKYFMIYSSYYLQNTPYPDRHILCISENNATYTGNLIHPYYQHI